MPLSLLRRPITAEECIGGPPLLPFSSWEGFLENATRKALNQENFLVHRRRRPIIGRPLEMMGMYRNQETGRIALLEARSTRLPVLPRNRGSGSMSSALLFETMGTYENRNPETMLLEATAERGTRLLGLQTLCAEYCTSSGRFSRPPIETHSKPGTSSSGSRGKKAATAPLLRDGPSPRASTSLLKLTTHSRLQRSCPTLLERTEHRTATHDRARTEVENQIEDLRVEKDKRELLLLLEAARASGFVREVQGAVAIKGTLCPRVLR